MYKTRQAVSKDTADHPDDLPVEPKEKMRKIEETEPTMEPQEVPAEEATSAPKKEAKKKAGPKAGTSKKEKKVFEPKKWLLDKDRFVNVTEYKGNKLADIREHYKDKVSGELKPGKKGISLKLTEWKQLMLIGQEVTEAMEDD